MNTRKHSEDFAGCGTRVAFLEWQLRPMLHELSFVFVSHSAGFANTSWRRHQERSQGRREPGRERARISTEGDIANMAPHHRTGDSVSNPDGIVGYEFPTSMVPAWAIGGRRAKASGHDR